MDTLARLGDEYFRLHFAGDPLLGQRVRGGGA